MAQTDEGRLWQLFSTPSIVLPLLFLTTAFIIAGMDAQPREEVSCV
ncbi:MAG: hypothetical protein ACYCZF_00515 [Anaerolineae bacterium]